MGKLKKSVGAILLISVSKLLVQCLFLCSSPENIQRNDLPELVDMLSKLSGSGYSPKELFSEEEKMWIITKDLLGEFI